jgi:class 3 adenylate cyclase
MVADYVERRLAAIVSADVADYSRLIGADEEGTTRRLRELRAELIDPAINAHRGRVVKTMGDGILVEFASVVDAVRCSLQLQRGFTARNAKLRRNSRIEFRIGIHVGDVMVQPDGDLLGDGVNIAARLEAIAERGGIYLSEDAYRQVRDRLKEEFVDLGEKQLKNIARPMRVYAVAIGPETSAVGKRPESAQPRPHIRQGQTQAGVLNLPTPVRVRAPGRRAAIKTVAQAMNFIERNLPPELASLPRWTFARALLVEATKTGKSRDVNAAARQFKQALQNERWLDDDDRARGAMRDN